MKMRKGAPIIFIWERLAELAEMNQDTVSLYDLKKHFESDPKIQDKLIHTLANFKKMKLIDRKQSTSGVYQLDIDAIIEFNKLYKQDKVKLWYCAKGQQKKIKTPENGNYSCRFSGSCHELAKKYPDIPLKLSMSAQFYARAAVTCQTDSFSNREITGFCNNRGIDITDKAFSNLLVRQSRLFTRPEQFRYFPNKIFFRKYAKEKQFYKILFPDLSDIIDKNYTEINEKKSFVKKDRHTIINAIAAAYTKALSVFDYIRIVDNKGFKIGEQSIRNILKASHETICIAHQEVKQIFYAPNDNFFFFNRNNVESFCKLFPERSEIIKERFNTWQVNQKEEIPNKQSSKELSESEENIASETPVENDSTIENEQIEASQDDQSGSDQQELIDMANVGQSIVAYINKLKKEAKLSTKSNEYLQLKEKHENLSNALINTKNENQSLSGQLEKLKGIVESQNEKIKDLSHKLSVAENKAIPEKKPINGAFKMAEVTRITRLIKKDDHQQSHHQISRAKGR